jgi:hypothetical protein
MKLKNIMINKEGREISLQSPNPKDRREALDKLIKQAEKELEEE